ncbi:MAG: MTH1187 family thiamine-binding protein [Acidobacteriaceae bacterium]
MLASFSVVPLDVTGGVKDLVAEALKIVDASELDYSLGAMQTTVEGDADAVTETILACHRRMLELAPRVLTHIAIDERKGATGRLEGKVRDVEEVVGKPLRRTKGGRAGQKTAREK